MTASTTLCGFLLILLVSGPVVTSVLARATLALPEPVVGQDSDDEGDEGDDDEEDEIGY